MRPSTFLNIAILIGSSWARPQAQVPGGVPAAKTSGTSPSVTYGASQTVAVETSTARDGRIIQRPADPTLTPDAGELGLVNTILDRVGRPTDMPLLDVDPSDIGDVIPVSAATKVFESAATIIEAVATGVISVAGAVVEDVTDALGAPAEAVDNLVENIFVPISTESPPSLFSRRNNHPVPPKSIVDSGVPLHTNKFYSNLYLGSQNAPVQPMPYEVWWSNQKDDPWGLSIDHREPEVRAYAEPKADGSIEYYINPIWRRSISLGAAEFEQNKSTMEMKNLSPSGMAVDVTFYADKTAYGANSKKMETTLCQGMGFITGTYTSLTPAFHSSLLFRSLVKQENYEIGAVKYKVTLEDNSVWLIYGWTSAQFNSNQLELELVNNGLIRATKEYNGLVQIVKLAKNTEGNAEAEAIYDAASGAFCADVELFGSKTQSSAAYGFKYTKKGFRDSKLLMFALPHHRKSFDAATNNQIKEAVKYQSPTKGEMTAVLSDSWTMVESELPTNIGFLPVNEGGVATISPENLEAIQAAAIKEVAQDVAELSNLADLYYAGKPLAKYGYICLTASDILRNTALATECLEKLKGAFARFTSNMQQHPLVYEESTWRGLMSDAIFSTGDLMADFGSGAYNDHHFHYGYFVQAAALIGYLDTKLQSGSWVRENKEWVNLLIRDVANPSPEDKFFPVYRSFDWFHGHSWAKGLFESLDGKDEESSSEDYNFAYAMKLWGNVSGDEAMEARGNLMLAIMKRSMNEYMLLSPGNENHPEGFVLNRLSGVLHENKVHYITYFGANPEYIHGIHMIPMTPISPYIRNRDYVEDEWKTFFEGKTEGIQNGWRGILHANLALSRPQECFQFFNSPSFKDEYLDGGASKTWALAFAAALGGAA